MACRHYRKRIMYIFVFGGLFLLYLSSSYQYLFTLSYDTSYIHNGPTDSFSLLVSNLQRNKIGVIKPINQFNYSYIFSSSEKCKSDDKIRLLFVITSTADHFEHRETIRRTWGDEKRFSDVIIRRVFLLARKGTDHATVQTLVKREANAHKDIIQGNFKESYSNVTLKTMMGLDWTFHHCINVSYFIFSDDDMYVSTKNALRFVRNPMHYPKYIRNYGYASVSEIEFLYAGKVYNYSIPFRCTFSKFYVSLNEYPYSYWPPYVSGAFYILSRKSLEKLYYGSIFTNYFKLEDIFLGMAAKKAGLTLSNQREIYSYQEKSSGVSKPNGYQWAISVHGFNEPIKLEEKWNEQRKAGNV